MNRMVLLLVPGLAVATVVPTLPPESAIVGNEPYFITGIVFGSAALGLLALFLKRS